MPHESLLLSDVIRQAAHDLRSPLAALNYIMKDLPEVSNEKRTLVSMAIQKIKKIADDLLVTPDPPQNLDLESLSHQDVFSLIEQVIVEKRIEYRSNPNILIHQCLDFTNGPFVIHTKAIDLCRILSNLINNAVESFDPSTGSGQEKSGEVHLHLKQNFDKIILIVQDNGKGIPQQLLQAVVKKGESFGKKNGCGLGLYHAKTKIESWGGKLEIFSNSKERRGTSICITFPKADLARKGFDKNA